MYDLIYNTLNLIDLNNSLMVSATLENLEHLLTGIIPNVYFAKQKSNCITWVIKSYDRGEIYKVIIGKKTFVIVS